MVAFQKAPSEVAILYSITSIAYNADHLAELRAVYQGTFFSDTKVSFVTERTIPEGALAKIKLLIVPTASHLPQPVVRTIAEWAKGGGKLVLVGDCLQRDQRNRELPELLDGLAWEARWNTALAESADALDDMAEEALKEHRAGRTKEKGFDEL